MTAASNINQICQRASLFLLAFISLALMALNATANNTLTFYAYHDSPPFIINKEKEKGVNYDLIRAFQAEVEPGVNYRFEYLSRPEINKRLAEGLPTIVLWANPTWFEKSSDHQYLWSHPLFWDKDVIVGLKENNFPYEDISDLEGHSLGTRAGYFYHTIVDMVAQKKVIRKDSNSDEENIKQLVDGKVDFIIISKSSLLYHARTLNLINALSILGKPHSSFHRQLLVTKHYQDHMKHINAVLDKLSQDSNWHFRISIYGLQDLWPTDPYSPL